LTWSTFVDHAIEHVLQNKGARTPGIDGQTRKLYQSHEARLAWRKSITAQLRSGTFRPDPVRRVYIDKPNKPGQKRPLGIPTLADRVGQELLRSVLEPIFESRFHPHAYGFRPFRSTHHAIERVRSLIKQGYTWVIEGDIRGFFDHVDHDILMQLVQREVGDSRILRLIRAFLEAGALEDGTFTVTDEGTPQGGILSPLLANIYLNELDWYVAHMYENLTKYARKKQPLGCFICRFADDFVILVRGTQEQTMALKGDVTRFLRDTLRLELSPEKTLVTHVDTGFDFLGFHIRRYERNGREVVLATPSKKAQIKFMERVRELTHSVSSYASHLWILDLNVYLSGWAEYFRRGNSKRTFSKLDHILWWLIARRMRKRWQGSKAKGGYKKFLREQLIPYRFDVQRPHYRRYQARNFGHWVDSEKQLALIVDHLAYHPIHYAPLYSQVHPYTPEGREKVTALRQAGRLVNRAWRTGPPEKVNGSRVYAMMHFWLAQKNNQCTASGNPLNRQDVQHLLKRLVGRLLSTFKGKVKILCKTCLTEQ
jgi:RNA-directed DNA polymerase